MGGSISGGLLRDPSSCRCRSCSAPGTGTGELLRCCWGIFLTRQRPSEPADRRARLCDAGDPAARAAQVAEGAVGAGEMMVLGGLLGAFAPLDAWGVALLAAVPRGLPSPCCRILHGGSSTRGARGNIRCRSPPAIVGPGTLPGLVPHRAGRTGFSLTAAARSRPAPVCNGRRARACRLLRRCRAASVAHGGQRAQNGGSRSSCLLHGERDHAAACCSSPRRSSAFCPCRC